MPNYDLNRLGAIEFERLCQSLLKEVIGNGVTIFGEGPDGGREATFSGKAAYPSQAEPWTGEWIFQAKFHNTQTIKLEDARQQVLADLKAELHKVTKKYTYKCDNYILITNVPLSSVSNRGTHDRISLEVISEYAEEIPHIHVWGYDDICRFLEKYSDVRQTYLHFITPGDLIAELMQFQESKSKSFVQTIRSFMTTSFRREQYAQLDQAGQVKEDRMPLQKIFIDLDVQFMNSRDYKRFFYENFSSNEEDIEDDQDRPISAIKIMLSEKSSKMVLIGGPGEGKSTLGQYLAQIHRATLLNRQNELHEKKLNLNPLVARIPFRIILKDYAQWLSGAGSKDGLEFYICEQVQGRSSTSTSPDEISDIFNHNPCLLILDGLDEVTDLILQEKVLDRVSEFLDRCEHVLGADLQVVATSRPTSYSGQFDANKFIHLQLTKLTSEKVLEYVDRWSQAKQIDDLNTRRIMQTIQECLSDKQTQLLMNTPLQVTILILIVLSGGTPPRQREALFHEYLEVIYKRESAKAIIQTNKEELFELHEYLGYVLHKRASEAQDVRSLFEKNEFIKEVKKFLRFNDPYTSDKLLDQKVEAIVREAEERFVLIVEPEDNFFGFELRPLQEFFAAGHLANALQGDIRYKRFEAIARLSHWRNVALFFAGRIGRVLSAEAANIIEVCRYIDREKPDLFLKRGATLALELAADRSFGHKRRLQWSIIEYGLTIINEEIETQQVLNIKSTLIKLPEEDIRDLVLPVLKAKLFSTSFNQLNAAFSIYHFLDASSEFLLEALDALCSNPDKQYVLYAFQKSVELKINPSWVSSRIKKYFSVISKDDLGEIFGDTSILYPQYIQKCLKDCPLDLEYSTILLDKALTTILHRRPRFPERFLPPEETSLDLLTLDNQMFSTFYVLNLIAVLLDPSYNTSSLKTNIKSSNYVSEIQKQFKLAIINQNLDLLPHLKACLWLLHFIIEPKDTSVIKYFVPFYKDVKDQANSVFICLRQLTQTINPLMELLLQAIDIDSSELIESVCLLITQYGDQTGIKALHYQIGLIEGSPFNDQMQLATLFGLSMITDTYKRKQIEYNLKETLGISTSLISPLLLMTFSSSRLDLQKVTLTAEQLSLIFDFVFKDLSTTLNTEKFLRRIRYVSWMKWTLDEHEALDCVLLIHKLSTNMELYSQKVGAAAYILFLKLYESVSLPKEVVIPIFRDLGKLTVSNSRDFGRITPNTIKLILINSIPYFSSEEQEVQQGAAKLVNSIIDNLYIRPLRQNFFNVFQSDIDYTIIKQLIESQNFHIKVLGINLLPFFPLYIHHEDGHILTSIVSSQSIQEIRAWSRFIQHVQLPEDVKNRIAWKTFLESILVREHKVSPIILRAVRDSYNTLVVLEENISSIDENKLGLPLSRDDL